MRHRVQIVSSFCSFTNNSSAVRKAWSTPYVSDRHKLLVDIITRMKTGTNRLALKAGELDDNNTGELDDSNNTVTIVQSSGTGKSRMVDEAARLVFTLPFNLRGDQASIGTHSFSRLIFANVVF